MKKKPKLYRVEWIDAFSAGGWKNLEDLKDPEPMKIQTVGYLIHEGKRYDTYAQNLSSGNRYSDTMSIPKGWIKRRTPL